MQLTIKNASSALLFCVYKHLPKKREYMCIYMAFFHFVLKLFDNAFEQSLGVFRFRQVDSVTMTNIKLLLLNKVA